MSYTNSNGLVNGNIPAGQPCPFAAECGRKNEHCPVPGKVKPNDFSCALARLNSLIADGKKKGESLPLLESVRDSVSKKEEG